MEIIKTIGTPAILEQCAEECSELSHACLKMARKIRGENPTPAEHEDILNSIAEEMADVYLCMEYVQDELYISGDDICDFIEGKRARWNKRIEEMEKEKNEQSRDETESEEK